MKNKTCKNFCEKVFFPERERVERKFTKTHNIKYIKPTKFVKDFYLHGCNDIYCKPRCNSGKRKWSKSFTKKRKARLIKQGAISGCRDLHKEFPDYYENI